MTSLPIWADLLLALLLVLRLNRLIIADSITEDMRFNVWAWAMRREGGDWAEAFPRVPEYGRGWRTWLFVGLMCPFCVGFWVGALVLASLAAVGGPGDASEWWRWVALVFALNWVAGHLGARAGDTAENGNE